MEETISYFAIASALATYLTGEVKKLLPKIDPRHINFVVVLVFGVAYALYSEYSQLPIVVEAAAFASASWVAATGIYQLQKPSAKVDSE